ncbi:hypothetical protein D3C78_1775780 [compost metagenome]
MASAFRERSRTLMPTKSAATSPVVAARPALSRVPWITGMPKARPPAASTVREIRVLGMVSTIMPGRALRMFWV